MHLNLKLNGCFSLGYDLPDPSRLPEEEGGTVCLALPIDHFSALIRKGLSCRLESSFQRGRAGRILSIREQDNALLVELSLKKPAVTPA